MATQVAPTRPLAVLPVTSLNPFRLTGTGLPPNLLLMAKFVTLCFILTGQVSALPDHFLPFLRIFDSLGSPLAFHRALEAIFVVAAIALFLNRSVRIACIVLGGVILLGLLSSRVYFENNRMFTGCILVLAGLSTRDEPFPLVRAQVVLLYAAAAANKLLEANWRTGHFFDSWVATLSHHALYGRASALFPALFLSTLVDWSVIITEFVIAAGFLYRRFFLPTIWLAIGYHTTLMLVTGRSFGMFWYALLGSYLAFAPWPAVPATVATGGWRWRALGLLARFHLQGPIRLEAAKQRGMAVLVNQRQYWGMTADLVVLLLSPVFYLLFAVISSLATGNALRLVALLVLLTLGGIALGFLDRGRLLSTPAPR